MVSLNDKAQQKICFCFYLLDSQVHCDLVWLELHSLIKTDRYLMGWRHRTFRYTNAGVSFACSCINLPAQLQKFCVEIG